MDRTGKVVEAAKVLPGPERRCFPRTRSRIGASYEDADQQVFLYTADLAEGGVFLVSPIHPRVGANAIVLLELPGDPVILRLRGSVARRQTHPVAGFAVRFDRHANAESGQQALRRFVESALAGPAAPHHGY